MTDQNKKQLTKVDSARPERASVEPRVGDELVAASNQLSDLARLKADPRGSVELAAAKLGARFERLIHMAVNARPDITQQELAERLGVSAGRVSQVLSGNENPRVTTVARYLRALGYEVHVELEVAEPDVPAVGRYWRPGRRATVETSHIYVTLVTDGEATAAKFTVLPQTMSASHVAITPTVLLGEVTDESIMAVRPIHTPTRSIVAGQSRGEWKPFAVAK